MINQETILSFHYYSYGKPFTGSLNGKRYRIVKEEIKSDPDDVPEGSLDVGKPPKKIVKNYFRVHIWQEPFSFEKTDSSLMLTETFPFSESGFEAVLSYLNEHLVES